MTQSSRMERNLAHMDILVGRLEKALALLGSPALEPLPPKEPPLDSEALELSEKVIKAQMEELRERADA